MENKKGIPKKIDLTATDPFLKYLAYMYNSGIDYMLQSDDIMNNMEGYKSKLHEFVETNKLKPLLEEYHNKNNKSKAKKPEKM